MEMRWIRFQKRLCGGCGKEGKAGNVKKRGKGGNGGKGEGKGEKVAS